MPSSSDDAAEHGSGAGVDALRAQLRAAEALIAQQRERETQSAQRTAALSKEVAAAQEALTQAAAERSAAQREVSPVPTEQLNS